MASQLASVVVSLIANTNQYTSGLLKAQKDTASAASNMQSSLKKLDEQTRKHDETLKKSIKSQKQFRAAIGNAGYQVQDAAVQWQAGTDALVIFAQQGSQLASAFGPQGAVIGTIIALGSTLLSVLNPSLQSSEDRIESLVDRLRELESQNKLSTAEAGYLSVVEEKNNKTLKDSIAETKAKIASTKAVIASVYNYRSAVASNTLVINKETMAAERANKHLDEEEDKLKQLQAQLSVYTRSLEESTAKLNFYGEVLSGTTSRTEEQDTAIDELISSMQTQLETLGLSSTELAIYNARQNKASEAEINRIRTLGELIGKQKQIKKVEDELNNLRKEAEKRTQDLSVSQVSLEFGSLDDDYKEKAIRIQEDLNSELEKLEGRRLNKISALNERYQSEEARNSKEFAILVGEINKESSESKVELVEKAELKIRKIYDESANKQKEIAKELQKIQSRSLSQNVEDAKSRYSIFNPDSYREAREIIKQEFDNDLKVLERQLADGDILYETYLEKRNNLYRNYGEELAQNELELFNEIQSLGIELGNSYSNIAGDLSNASDEEAKEIKKNFLLKQAQAAAQATISYFASLSAYDSAYAGIPGGQALAEASKARATATYQMSLAGILATTLGGVAAFDIGSENVSNDQLALVHKGERILQPNINKDLTDYLSTGRDAQKSSAPIINNYVKFGGVYDPKQMQQMLSKNSETIAGLVTREEKRRPNQRRGR